VIEKRNPVEIVIKYTFLSFCVLLQLWPFTSYNWL
jgi:hypothetical protein